MYWRRIRLAKRLKSFKRLRLIPRFCDFGISSTFDAVLRYLPIFFLRYYGICRYFLRYYGVRHPPMSPSYRTCMERVDGEIKCCISCLRRSALGSISTLWPVSRKSRKLFGPGKPFLKLRLAHSVKLVFSYVAKGRKIKITAKFRALRRLRFEDTKRTMSPEMCPKSFGTFEKRAAGPTFSLSVCESISITRPDTTIIAGKNSTALKS